MASKANGTQLASQYSYLPRAGVRGEKRPAGGERRGPVLFCGRRVRCGPHHRASPPHAISQPHTATCPLTSGPRGVVSQQGASGEIHQSSPNCVKFRHPRLDTPVITRMMWRFSASSSSTSASVFGARSFIHHQDDVKILCLVLLYLGQCLHSGLRPCSSSGLCQRSQVPSVHPLDCANPHLRTST